MTTKSIEITEVWHPYPVFSWEVKAVSLTPGDPAQPWVPLTDSNYPPYVSGLGTNKIDLADPVQGQDEAFIRCKILAEGDPTKFDYSDEVYVYSGPLEWNVPLPTGTTVIQVPPVVEVQDFGPITFSTDTTPEWQIIKTSVGGSTWVPALNNGANGLSDAHADTTNVPGVSVTTQLIIDSGVVDDSGQIRCVADGVPTNTQHLEVLVAGAPTLLFSDMTSAPRSGWDGSPTKGACVTVWGVNLGSSGTITVNGEAVTDYTTGEQWGDKSKPVPWLERVSFFLNSSMPTSGEGIVLTANGKASNALAFTPRDTGRILFIDINLYVDENTQSGTGTLSDPFINPWQPFGPADGDSLVPGDVLYARAGTFDDLYMGSSNTTLYLSNTISGTAAEPIAFVAYPGETVNIVALGATSGDRIRGITKSGDHWVFAKFSVDTNSVGISGGEDSDKGRNNTGYIRIVGNDMVGQRVYESGTATIVTLESGAKALGNVVTGARTDNALDHCIYLGGATPAYAAQEIAYNYMYDNAYSDGPHISINQGQNEDRTEAGYSKGHYIHHNWIDARQINTTTDFKGGRALGAYDTGYNSSNPDWDDPAQVPVMFYNNIVITDDNLGVDTIQVVTATCHSAYIDNNVFIGGDWRIVEYGSAVRSNLTYSKFKFRNNIVEVSDPSTYYLYGPFGFTSEEITNNCFFGGDAGTTDTTGTEVLGDSGIVVDVNNFTVTLPSGGPCSGQADTSVTQAARDWNQRLYGAGGNQDIGPVLEDAS